MPVDVTVINNEQAHRFQAEIDGHLSVLEYRQTPHRIAFTHTEVPPPLEGKGMAAALTRAGLDFAREHNLKVVPYCPYVAAYIKRHPEYADLVQEPAARA